MTARYFLIILSILLALSTQQAASETWNVTSLNWEPYSGAEMTHQGNAIQKLRELLKKGGINLVVEFYPWRRAQQKAQKPSFIGYFPAWPEEVYGGFIASPAIDISYIGVMKRAEDSIEFSSIDELFKNYCVGVVKTYTYPEAIHNAIKKYPNNVEMAANELLLLRKLAKGRSHVAITDPDVMHYLAEREGIPNIETVKVIMEKELVIAFKNNEESLKRIAILKELLKQQ